MNRVVLEDAADVYVKLEFENPAGSIKDRIALAMVAAAKGYHIIIVMPETMSVERRKLMKGYGAELILTPGSEGMKGLIAKAKELVKEKGYYMPMQFDNPENPNIHESTTGPEIIAAMNGIGKSVDAFVVGVDTGGTLSGIGRALKKEDPNTKVYALEPSEAPLLKEGKTGKHGIQGIQGIAAGFIPNNLDKNVYDGIVEVSTDEAMDTACEVAKNEGFSPGISAGANIHGAIELVKKLGKGHTVVIVSPDGGDRYLSTALFNEE